MLINITCMGNFKKSLKLKRELNKCATIFKDLQHNRNNNRGEIVGCMVK